MRAVLPALLAALLGCPTAARDPGDPAPAAIEALFRRTLVVGASVSADANAISPGRRLARKYGYEDDLVAIARGGTPGREVLAGVPDSAIAAATVIVGIDLFFWDSAATSCGPSAAAVRQIADAAEAAGVPLALGDVPELLPGRQPCRAAINDAIRARCGAGRACRVVSLDAMHREAQRDGSLRYQGREWTLQQLLPDGLHLSDVASQYLAEQLERALAP